MGRGFAITLKTQKSFYKALFRSEHLRSYSKAQSGARALAQNFNRTDIARKMYEYSEIHLIQGF